MVIKTCAFTNLYLNPYDLPAGKRLKNMYRASIDFLVNYQKNVLVKIKLLQIAHSYKLIYFKMNTMKNHSPG